MPQTPPPPATVRILIKVQLEDDSYDYFWIDVTPAGKSFVDDALENQTDISSVLNPMSLSSEFEIDEDWNVYSEAGLTLP